MFAELNPPPSLYLVYSLKFGIYNTAGEIYFQAGICSASINHATGLSFEALFPALRAESSTAFSAPCHDYFKGGGHAL